MDTILTQRHSLRITLLSINLFLVLAVNANTWYVKPGGNNANAGDSWTAAFQTLQKALDTASAGDTIRLAGGTYYPEKDIGGTGLTNRDWTFLINKNLVIKGAYDPASDMQDFQNQQTVLSGDIDTNGDLSGNAYHVVVTMGLSLSAVLDGLQIEGGNADGAGSITYAGRTVFRDLGGGLYNAGENAGRRTSPTVTNCTILNCAANQGGGVYAIRSDSRFYNCLIANSTAVTNGGAAQNNLTQIIYTNCTFYNNAAGTSGGGLGVFGGNVTVHNSVFWANTAPGDPDVQVVSATSSCNAAQPDSHWNGTSGFVILFADPFRDSADPDGADNQYGTADDGLFPGLCSPLVAAGNNASNSEPTDLAGTPRVQGTTIDIGAFEYAAPATTFYVDAAAAPPGDGLSWNTAFTDLQDAICIADAGATIYVAGGTYYPAQYPAGCYGCSTPRDYAFYVAKDVHILGGYDPTSGLRDLANQETILSGDIDLDNIRDAGNVYHVLIIAPPSQNVTLDGLTVKMGNASGGGTVFINGQEYHKNWGGGIVNCFSFADFNNCKISGNRARYGGGCANIFGGVPVFRDCILTDNTAYAEGGGMYNYFTSPNLYSCVLSGNTAIDPANLISNTGGGMQNTESNPKLYNCVFDQNSARNNGGAMGDSLATDTPSRPQMVNCTFWGNSAEFGGAIYVADGQIKMFNSVFWNNTADGDGDDVYFHGGSYNNTDKNAGANGGGVQGTTGFIALNADPFRNSSDPDGPDNIWGTNDDGLSPALFDIIDVGNNARNTEPTDLAGNDRIQYTTIDIGAYEFQEPVAICQNQIVQLDMDGTATLDVSQLDNGSIGYAPFSFTVNGMSSLEFSCADAGSAVVYTLTVTDGFNETATCMATVTVQNDLFPCISGRIIWDQDGLSGVKDVQVNLSGDETGSTITPLDGTYTFNVSNGSDFSITPSKNINKLNGISVADVLAIQQHVTFINPITDPYKLIAADVNKSNSISTFDASILNQALLGNPAALNIFSRSWRFVPQDYALPTPPWGFPEKINLVGVSGNQSDLNFYGIKIGDIVDENANPANFGAGMDPLVWRVQDQLLEAGQDLQVTFTADFLANIAAFQFGLRFDPQQLELENVEQLTALPLNEDHFGLFPVHVGALRVVWTHYLGFELPHRSEVFRLHFKVLQSGARLSEVLSLDEALLQGLAYNKQLERNIVQLDFTPVTATKNPAQELSLFESWPNPFVHTTNLRFHLPKACQARIRVLDESGRELWRQEKMYPAGNNVEQLQLEGISASGLLICEMVTPYGTRQISLLRVER